MIELVGPFVSAIVGDEGNILTPVGPPNTVLFRARQPGRALIDEDFLRAEGVTDFACYRCDPEHEPPRVGFDLRFTAG